MFACLFVCFLSHFGVAFQAVAESVTEQDYEYHLNQLMSSDQWQGSAQLQRYITQEWLACDRPKVRQEPYLASQQNLSKGTGIGSGLSSI